MFSPRLLVPIRLALAGYTVLSGAAVLLGGTVLAGCTAPADTDAEETGREAVVGDDDAPTLPAGPVIGVANIDDDDENGEIDWDDAAGGEDAENDRVAVDLSGFGPLDLSLEGEGLDTVRVWRDGELLLGTGATSASAVEEGVFEVEFGAFLSTATLRVTPTDTPESAVTLTLAAAPLILNNHLQGAELVVAMSATGRSGNEAFVDGFSGALPGAFESFSLQEYGWDVWVQDELEFATQTAPGHRMDVVIDSIRTAGNRYLDKLPEAEFEGPDTAVETWGGRTPTSQDSFGNLEVSPPVTVGGVAYPFGRIYWGENRGRGLTNELAELLEAQKVQDPFQLDISWLCVGHVDEFSSFVPDPTAPKGFRFLYADIPLGRSFLEGLDPALSLPRYRTDHGYATVGDILEDDALWASNEDMQADYLDPNLEIFKAELGLDEADIVRIPAVFEESAKCGGGALALIPATVNLVVADVGDGTTQVFLPDPYLRTDDDDPGSDPFIDEVSALLPANLTLNWLDDWDTYHLQWGEVHCGSNTRRPPDRDWWTDAMHLLEVE